MSTVAPPETFGANTSHRARGAARTSVPLTRIVSVELRKSVDTRAGAWLLAGIGVASLLATSAVILWAPADQFTYRTFTQAINFPTSVILPMIALLSVTAEWSQRSGLTTFTLVPHRGLVLAGKGIAAALISLVATLVALAVGAVGNLVGAAVVGTPPVWDMDATAPAYLLLSNTLLMLVGFVLGVLIRNSPGAIVAYFVYSFVLPPALTLLAFTQGWFRDLRPWVDPSVSQGALLDGGFTGDQWAQLALTTAVWLVVPLAVGVRALLRSEVK